METVNGIVVGGTLPPTANNFRGACLVAGSGRCLWDDIERLWRKHPNWSGDFLGINWAGLWLPFPVKHIVSLHPTYLKHWVALRDGSDGHIHTHSSRPEEGVESVWEFRNPAGMSGLFGAKVALGLGYSSVVLVGVPMDNSGHFYDPPDGLTLAGYPPFEIPNYHARASMLEWELARDEEFAGRVKSMSGITRQMLGEP